MLRLIKEHIRRKAFAAALKGRKAAQAGSGPVIQNLAEMGSIGFLYPLRKGDGIQKIRSVMEAFTREGIKVYGMVVECEKSFKNEASRVEFFQECAAFNVAFVGRNIFNWAGVPVTASGSGSASGNSSISLVEEFFARRYDLFVNLNAGAGFVLDFFALKADAGCMAGMHNNPKMPYSLVLEPANNGEFSYTAYIGGLLNYLKVINCKGDGE